jgi:hypothetical protein
MANQRWKGIISEEDPKIEKSCEFLVNGKYQARSG